MESDENKIDDHLISDNVGKITSENNKNRNSDNDWPEFGRDRSRRGYIEGIGSIESPAISWCNNLGYHIHPSFEDYLIIADVDHDYQNEVIVIVERDSNTDIYCLNGADSEIEWIYVYHFSATFPTYNFTFFSYSPSTVGTLPFMIYPLIYLFITINIVD